MITKIENVFAAESFANLRTAYIARARAEAGRVTNVLEWLQSSGFELVSEPKDEYLTSDGREILHVSGQAWALRPDIHKKRRDEAIEKALAERGNVQPSEVKESIATLTCPQMIDGKPCGGSLNRKGVCPSCVTGKMGYKYRYTCESCGFDIVTREELR